VQALLDADADTSAENNDGEIPVSLANPSSSIFAAINDHQKRTIWGKPSGIHLYEEQKPRRRDLDDEKLETKAVRERFKITVAEVHRNDSKAADNGSAGKSDSADDTSRKDMRPNHHWRSTRSVQEVIYEGSEIEGLFGGKQKTLLCRWLHVHRSNVSIGYHVCKWGNIILTQLRRHGSQ
jgi:hypothetical protein